MSYNAGGAIAGGMLASKEKNPKKIFFLGLITAVIVIAITGIVVWVLS
ncbi:MAG: hypothetical protein FWC00_06205 [Firmicutes bacterium]|nr:hypothetical protein [Bacillota bacterium]